MANIELRGVNKQFGDIKVIKDVSLTVEDNEFVVFVGPSGCGKSTLLRLIAGLEDLTSGEIHIDDARIDHLAPAARGLAMVFQSYALYPHFTVGQNMGYALRVAKEDKASIDKKVRAAAEILQLTDYLDRKPKALSGGQRQRVAIGRAIVRNPKVFLFDEPLSNLDAKLRVAMRIELTKLHRTLNATMIYVTHDQIEAMTMADKIVVLRDGFVEQIGAPLDLYNKPDNRFVAGFIGSPAMNFFNGEVSGFVEGGVEISLTDGAALTFPCTGSGLSIGDAVDFGVRPEHFCLGQGADGSLKGEVYAVERLGGETYLYLTSGSQKELVVHVSGDHQVAVGDHVEIGYSIAQSHLFGPDGQSVSAQDG
ncbi:MAG: sn-glycerol-3-phosphate ABC transporter ATP-binding protein UgpC [Rhodobacteraceae bacterium]|nr:sn-glycerol-3-phosphate ABC transporter ATP-binding protein UgpC [Paracoccaceae bacterium]